MREKTVLVIGSGGREHALVWKLSQSSEVAKIYVAPGNGGTATIAENVDIKASDTSGLVAFAKAKAVDLTVVGPDDALADGVVDAFVAEGLRIFGPTQAAAQIEASKAFSKQLMKQMAIPTASFEVFRDEALALDYIKTHSLPVVVKASGLALGKGVFICQTLDEATGAVSSIMAEKIFGEAGNEIVIEDYLVGPEISIHAISDGKHSVMFPSSQDHKAVFDGDKGPNTGGMGTIAPVPWVSPDQMDEVKKTIVQPILDGLSSDGRMFVGCLYPGLVMTSDGPKTLEYNARFGDPETQVYMRLLESDLYELLTAAVDTTLDTVQAKWRSGFAACIVLASGGYPGKYDKNLPIEGLDKAAELDGVVVFHAGTTYDGQTYRTNGGRVLGVTAVGDTLAEALDQAYKAARLITFEGVQYRTDIGAKSLKF